MTTQTPTPEQAELEGRLIGQKLALGRARKTLGEKIADGQDPGEARAAFEKIQLRILELEAGLDVFKTRAVEATDSRKKESARAQAAAFLQARCELRAAAKEIGQDIKRIGASGTRLMSAANAVIVFGDPTASYQATKFVNSLRPYVGHALRQFPGFETGTAPFLKLDQNKFEELFPDPNDPQNNPPPKKAA